jgi:hypothetical protein
MKQYEILKTLDDDKAAELRELINGLSDDEANKPKDE